MKKKYYTGEKYIYLLMAFMLCKKAGFESRKEFSKTVLIGHDTGFTGGQNYFRKFRLQKYDGKWLLNEFKNGKSFAEFSRTFEIGYSLEDLEKDKPMISDYINEYGENSGQVWIH
jgi:hypothetical protein